MNHKGRRTIIVGIAIILCGFITSPVFAGANAGAGASILNLIHNNPCGNFTYTEGGSQSIPVATCSGYQGAGKSQMQILLRGWDIEPSYPIANVPFVLGIGIDPASAAISFQGKATATFPGQIRFSGFKTELMLVPALPGGPIYLNGELVYDSTVKFNDWWDLQTMNPEFRPNIEVYSASVLNSPYYPGGNDTFFFGLMGLTSSYHAANPSTYKGEPAYRLGVTSRYIVRAKASWDYYQEWELIRNDYLEVCRPGRNAEGLYDCYLNPGDLYPNGHTETVLTPIYGWGTPVYGNNNTGFVDIALIVTDKVRWPDGTIHDHIPVLIYQSQPLLQKP